MSPNGGQNYRRLKEIARAEGIELFGVADLDRIREESDLFPRGDFDRFKYGISLGRAVNHSIVETIQDRPTMLYSHHYRQVNYLLDRVALNVSGLLQEEDHDTMCIPASQIIDWENLRGHLSHKQVARYAGLGWIGRNILLVNRTYGSRVRYVSVLTCLPLETDSPVDDSCGECRRCIDVCPAEAIGEDKDDFDLRKCFEKLRDFSKQRNIGQYICGVCLKACAGERRLPGRV